MSSVEDACTTEIGYLMEEIDDWEKVVNLWKNSFVQRNHKIAKMTSADIFITFPCLSQPLAGQLVKYFSKISTILYYISKLRTSLETHQIFYDDFIYFNMKCMTKSFL